MKFFLNVFHLCLLTVTVSIFVIATVYFLNNVPIPLLGTQ